jgi:hypothetical protein
MSQEEETTSPSVSDDNKQSSSAPSSATDDATPLVKTKVVFTAAEHPYLSDLSVAGIKAFRAKVDKFRAQGGTKELFRLIETEQVLNVIHDILRYQNVESALWNTDQAINGALSHLIGGTESRSILARLKLINMKGVDIQAFTEYRVAFCKVASQEEGEESRLVMDQFIAGLQPEVLRKEMKAELSQLKVKTLDELKTRALTKVLDIQKAQLQVAAYLGKSTIPSSPKKNVPSPTKGSPARVKCNHCGLGNHTEAKCFKLHPELKPVPVEVAAIVGKKRGVEPNPTSPKKVKPSPSPNKPTRPPVDPLKDYPHIKCHRCKEMGHYAMHCKKEL